MGASAPFPFTERNIMNNQLSITDEILKIQSDFKKLKLAARNYSQLEDARISYENRVHIDCLRTYDDMTSKKDERFLHALHGATPDDDFAEMKKVSAFTTLVNAEKRQEKFLIGLMQKAFTGEHMQAFLGTAGIGDKTIARICGEIGHPVLAFPHHWEETPDGDEDRVLVEDEPFIRNVGKLWAYCGVGDASLKRRKGMDQGDAFKLGNPIVKSIAYLQAANCMKMIGGVTKNGVEKPRSPYRDLYEQSKEYYTENREDWTPGHCNNAALRKVSKTILRDLWVAARDDLVDAGIIEFAGEATHPSKAAKVAA